MMIKIRNRARWACRLGAALLVMLVAASFPGSESHAQDLKTGKLRVAILFDIHNFDPQQFSGVNFPLIKNFYDSLIEYTPTGDPIPSLATSWTIAPDRRSVKVTLRKDVVFHSGAAMDANAIAATFKKAADPLKGRNVYATMSIVNDWIVNDPSTITVNFKNPVPDRQITDLLQFTSVIDPSAIDTVEGRPAGTGAYAFAERMLSQRIRMVANPRYWRPGQPVASEITLLVFSDNEAAAAALQSGAVDMIYGVNSRYAARLRGAGYQLIQGPGQLVQVFRINSTRGPFRNEKFRQAFNYLMDRESMLRVGYSGLGEVTALPWVSASPAYDKTYNATYAYNLDKAKELINASGLSQAEMSDWKFVVDGGDQDVIAISQIVQGSLAKLGINVAFDIRQGSDLIEVTNNGNFGGIFRGVGNVQKFPTRLATNSIYRTSRNAILGDPHPHPAYVEAMNRVDRTLGAGAEVKAANDNLNKALVEAAFGIPTTTYDIGIVIASMSLGGFTLDIDNMLVGRTIGFR